MLVLEHPTGVRERKLAPRARLRPRLRVSAQLSVSHLRMVHAHIWMIVHTVPRFGVKQLLRSAQLQGLMVAADVCNSHSSLSFQSSCRFQSGSTVRTERTAICRFTQGREGEPGKRTPGPESQPHRTHVVRTLMASTLEHIGPTGTGADPALVSWSDGTSCQGGAPTSRVVAADSHSVSAARLRCVCLKWAWTLKHELHQHLRTHTHTHTCLLSC